MADPALREPPLPILWPGPHFSALAVNSLRGGGPAHCPGVPHPPAVTSGGCVGSLGFLYLWAQGPEDRRKVPVAVPCLRRAPGSIPTQAPRLVLGMALGARLQGLPPRGKRRPLEACDSADRSGVGRVRGWGAVAEGAGSAPHSHPCSALDTFFHGRGGLLLTP